MKVLIPENKESFFWENIIKFFRAGFFRKKEKNFMEKIWGLRPESLLGSCIIYYSNQHLLAQSQQ